jgi:predicted transcriptional regulator
MHLKEIAEVADNLRTSLRLVIHELEKAEEVEDPDKAVEMRQKAVRDLKEIAGE